MRKAKKVEQQRGRTLNEIRLDHRNRYNFAVDVLTRYRLTQHVLDAGCGVGYGSSVLSSVVRQVHAIDREAEVVEIYESSYQKPNILFVRDDLMTAKFGSYDAVVCFELIEHIEHPEVIINRFSEVSDLLIISTPNENFYPFLKPNGKPRPFHYRHYTPEQFEELLYVGGFRVKEWHCQKDHLQCDIVSGTEGNYIIAVASK